MGIIDGQRGAKLESEKGNLFFERHLLLDRGILLCRGELDDSLDGHNETLDPLRNS